MLPKGKGRGHSAVRRRRIRAGGLSYRAPVSIAHAFFRRCCPARSASSTPAGTASARPPAAGCPAPRLPLASAASAPAAAAVRSDGDGKSPPCCAAESTAGAARATELRRGGEGGGGAASAASASRSLPSQAESCNARPGRACARAPSSVGLRRRVLRAGQGEATPGALAVGGLQCGFSRTATRSARLPHGRTWQLR